MGQVWSKADFDGINETGFQGGRGSVIAVTAQNAGPDGVWDTADDLVTPLNSIPSEVSIDWTVDDNERDALDRVRGFFSFHPGGSVFGFADASVTFFNETVDVQLYRHLSTRSSNELIRDFQ